MLTRSQKFSIAGALSVESLVTFVARLNSINALSEVEKAEGARFAHIIDPLYPRPKDGFIPKEVQRLCNQ